MFFSIDASNGVAIYEQIVRQVKFAIADEALQPGQLLPSARTLSVELAINPNTVVRAFQQLQAEGMLETVRGRGLAVRTGATAECKEMRRRLIAERLRSALSEALLGGLATEEIQSIVQQQLHELSTRPAAGPTPGSPRSDAPRAEQTSSG
ncbi:MAG: GntR family transcriptional regulator [Planctomycetales bacterium]|nr:GntR family transcriptional regulator [Planctomycetales bacterium]